MKPLLYLLVLLILISCAHKHGAKTHHHHDGSEEISAQDHGEGKYMIKDSGETYYFDTEKSFLEFEEKIKSRKNRPKCIRKGRNLVCEG
jgi:YHS domain-containing protein